MKKSYPLNPKTALLAGPGAQVFATASAYKYPNGRPKQRVIRTKKISYESLKKLMELGYTVLVV